MKKLLALSLFSAVLTGCSLFSSSTGNGDISDTSVGNGGWQAAEVQQAEMPSSMTNSSDYNNNMNYGNSGNIGQTETIGNCQVIRDASNTPIYGQIQKGCFTGSQYTVGKYDTLFLISYLSGQSVNTIANLNNLVQPYYLKEGQVLRVR